MKFVFTGDPRDGVEDSDGVKFDGNNPSSITMYDHTFQLNGEPVEVTGQDVIAKLRGNSHFTEVRPAE